MYLQEVDENHHCTDNEVVNLVDGSDIEVEPEYGNNTVTLHDEDIEPASEDGNDYMPTDYASQDDGDSADE
jgi:hypothetical protein